MVQIARPVLNAIRTFSWSTLEPVSRCDKTNLILKRSEDRGWQELHHLPCLNIKTAFVNRINVFIIFGFRWWELNVWEPFGQGWHTYVSIKFDVSHETWPLCDLGPWHFSNIQSCNNEKHLAAWWSIYIPCCDFASLPAIYIRNVNIPTFVKYLNSIKTTRGYHLGRRRIQFRTLALNKYEMLNK